MPLQENKKFIKITKKQGINLKNDYSNRSSGVNLAEAITLYSGDLNTEHLNTDLFEVQISNGTSLTI